MMLVLIQAEISTAKVSLTDLLILLGITEFLKWFLGHVNGAITI